MKTNLDTHFKSNEKLEKDGVEFILNDEGSCICVRRFGGVNEHKLKAALAKHYKPYAYQIDKGILSPEKEKEIYARVFAETSIVYWSKISIDDKEVEFTVENAVKLFTALPDLFATLRKYSEDIQNYRDDVGNSSPGV